MKFNIKPLIIPALCLLLTGACKGVMDTLQFHYSSTSVSSWQPEQFWNPMLSWKNKYKGGDPANGPKFPGSITMFVFLTDGWHLMQFFYLRLMVLSLVLSAFTRKRRAWYYILDFLLLTAAYLAGFHLLYTIIL